MAVGDRNGAVMQSDMGVAGGVATLDGSEKLTPAQLPSNVVNSVNGASGNVVLSSFIAPEMHRNIYRGKNLGSVVTEAQIAAINSGTFEDLYVGDYWAINSVNWRIADMDYFYRVGDTDFTKHHLVIVPDTSLYNAQMNAENSTDGGYINSQMRTENLEQAKEKVSSAFGGLVLTHKDYLISAVTDGHGSAGAWVESTVELMNEIMVCGAHIRAAMNTGNPVASTYTTGKQQFALFALDPKKVNIRVTYWLRDVVSAAHFALVTNTGTVTSSNASTSAGVRPYFCVGFPASTLEANNRILDAASDFMGKTNEVDDGTKSMIEMEPDTWK